MMAVIGVSAAVVPVKVIALPTGSLLQQADCGDRGVSRGCGGCDDDIGLVGCCGSGKDVLPFSTGSLQLTWCQRLR